MDKNNEKVFLCLKKNQINMSYLSDSYIVFTLKMESVSKNTIFGLKSIHYKRRAFSIFTSQKSNTFVEKIQNNIGMAGV